MEARIRKGTIVISLPVEQPRISGSGKTLVIASSRGTRHSTARFKGKVVFVNVNAFVYPSGRIDVKEPRKKRRSQTGD